MKTRKQLTDKIKQHQQTHSEQYNAVAKLFGVDGELCDILHDFRIRLHPNDYATIRYDSRELPIVFDLSGDRPMAAYCDQWANSDNGAGFSSTVRHFRGDFMDRKGKLHSFWVTDDCDHKVRRINGYFDETYIMNNAPPEFSKLTFAEMTTTQVAAASNLAVYTDFMTVPKAINNLRQEVGADPLPPEKTNEILAAIKRTIEGLTPVAELYEGRPSDVYTSERSGSGFKYEFHSCMSGNDREYFELYDDLYGNNRIRMILIYPNAQVRREPGNHIGRAIVWCDSSGTPTWLDRFYTRSINGDQDSQVVKCVYDWCVQNNISKTCSPKNPRLVNMGLSHVTIRIPVSGEPDNYSYLPYVDSLQYWCDDGFLRCTESGCVLGTLSHTDGSYEGGEETVIDYAGNRIPADEAVELRCGDYALRDECTELSSRHYGWGQYVLDEYAVEDYRGDFIHEEDAQYCEHSNSQCHVDDAIELHDGTYAHPDMDIVEMYDGYYALINDTTEASDGAVVLIDDLAEYQDKLREQEPQDSEDLAPVA